MFVRALSAALLVAATAAGSAPPAATRAADNGEQWARHCKDWDDWDKPAPPFRIYGNTYYVGTCGISAILITSDHGDILIDGGPANAGGLVAKNIRTLGIELSDVKLLLHTHEHHDHVGGLAELQRLTGASLFASAQAAPVLASGKAGAGDPQFADHQAFPSVRVGGKVSDGRPVRIADLSLIPIATPGHTPGALSWQWKSCEGKVCKTIVYADSLTPVSSDGYRFSDHPAYLAAFKSSLGKIGALRCDILLSPHPSASNMRDRLLKGDLTDANACKAYAARLTKQLEDRLAKEAGGK